ncbi:MAG: serine/threonine protein kinase [Steroidobacteraceae bacterium]
MSIRVLCISDQPEFMRLLQHHIDAFMSNVVCKQYSPQRQGELHEAFIAVGYELVLLDGACAEGAGLLWLQNLATRVGFAPILFFGTTATAKDEALRLGATGCFWRERIINGEFASVMREVVEQRKRQSTSLSARQDADKHCQFGDVLIRGHRLIKPLGAGGTSNVYLAESEKEGEVVVLKVLSHNPDTVELPEGYDRFLQEYHLLAGIHHPNVVHIVDFGVSDDHAFIAMEYFPCGDLRRRMQQEITVKQALGYVEQIAKALTVVHAVGVLHRDLKPGNIMLRDDDSLALIDFGVAKELRATADITAAGTIFGTPYYMSPEQGHGEPVDVRSDLYSLGVMLYELLTQKRPYSSDSVMNVIYMHRHLPLPELPKAIAWLEPLVHRLMAKQPKHRYQSAIEVISALGLMKLMASTLN